jgi:hypothetical protein
LFWGDLEYNNKVGNNDRYMMNGEVIIKQRFDVRLSKVVYMEGKNGGIEYGDLLDRIC